MSRPPVKTRHAIRSPETAMLAATYVRMSTEHQQYSTENQIEAIEAFAVVKGFQIVRRYADEGRSGLRLDGREGLQALLWDVESGNAGFSVILVYDVSRWGRFQDPDESASYEIRCKHAGVRVLYCAEQFENDGTPISSVIKSLKRTMAGEYSRELSDKVKRGQVRFITMGYRQGGPAGYGLRRQMVGSDGAPKVLMVRGEHKALQTDRVVLVPGPDDEVATVRKMYSLFVEGGHSEAEIAEMLNRDGIQTDLSRPWTRGTVHQVLVNDKYVGDNVWNRTSFRLKETRVRNPPASWVRADGAFEPIVERIMFEAARQMILARSYRLSDEEMLRALRNLLLEHGFLSGIVIDETASCPSSSAYQCRFGSLLRSYALIGYTPARDYRYIEINRLLRAQHPVVMQQAIEEIRSIGSTVSVDPLTDLLTVNQEFTVSLALSRLRETKAGTSRWFVRFDAGLCPDITVIVRMEANGQTARDYFLLPAMDLARGRILLADTNEWGIDIYRRDRLDSLTELSKRVTIRRLTYGP
jgi:DNA invertase Pin-like site-specific DNA recombinase